jgi:hypothetical protein
LLSVGVVTTTLILEVVSEPGENGGRSRPASLEAIGSGAVLSRDGTLLISAFQRIPRGDSAPIHHFDLKASLDLPTVEALNEVTDSFGRPRAIVILGRIGQRVSDVLFAHLKSVGGL